MAIPRVGEQFRQFHILAKAGEGGMGVVFRAEDTRLGRNVALKFLTQVGRVGAAEAERLRQEARSLAALNHPNIVSIYDIGEVDESPFLVLEWVSGAPLSAAFHARSCGESEFLGIALPVAEALAATHSRNIVHRDVKPANVLLTEDGDVKLVDFGIAKLRDAHQQVTKTGTIAGTAAYMSPEQVTGGEVGPASDIFSFGALAYELLTGRTPFEGASVPAVLLSIAHSPHLSLAIRRPDLSADVMALVERCLQKDPAARFRNGAELAQELHRAVGTRSAQTTQQLSRPSTKQVDRSAGRPEIRFCSTADGASIAYAVTGAGPILVRVLGWFTHLEREWEWPALRLIWERLAETHTVVRYDGRGIGLSGPWAGDFTEETRQLDLDAVLNAVGAERAALYGVSEGGWTAAWCALHRPERVSHLILYGAYSRGARFRDGFDPEFDAAVLTVMRKGWGQDTPAFRQIFTTAYFGPDADPGLVAHFNQLQRASADPETAARYQESLNNREDGSAEFAKIRTPTLVIHSQDDQIIGFAEGRRLASIIPGAQFLPLPTGTHYFPVADEVTHKLAEAISRFTR